MGCTKLGRATFDPGARPRFGALAVLGGDELGVAVLRPVRARAAGKEANFRMAVVREMFDRVVDTCQLPWW